MAHGVSRGETRTTTAKPRRGDTFRAIDGQFASHFTTVSPLQATPLRISELQNRANRT